jgi:hypothetical protein
MRLVALVSIHLTAMLLLQLHEATWVDDTSDAVALQTLNATLAFLSR